MKKNLLDKTTAAELMARANALQADSKGKWGEMNVTEMLHHCNLTTAQVLDGDMECKPSTLKQRLLRILSLYVVPQFPKNLPGAARNDTKGKIDSGQFAVEKQRFLQLLDRFGNHKAPIALTHPAFGNLNTRQWGLAAWMHLDHHLRQFGV
ncbi:DUF1569 domain-containing protein [Pontibacter chitinilyticus]|uniref:DUF1569 domain-containing protein n=1 Tax=Pontibacter chitinilyticus TaxID=2674989 RepID=UPI00321C1761